MEYLDKYSLFRTLKIDWYNLQIIVGKKNCKFNLFQILYPRFLPIVIIRLAKCMYERKLVIVAYFLEYVNIILFGLEVPAGLHIGEGLVIAHTFGTVLGAKSIGKNVTIYHQVTIGSIGIDNAELGLRPIIMDDVTLYVGAKILGNISIGTGAVIGANAVVLKDVPEFHVAYGIPAISKPNSKMSTSS